MTKNRKRCPWGKWGDTLYEKYHDEEWGVPVYDDRVIFEFLVLESAQAGLSWSTILRKREGYRKAFAQFDAQKVAQFKERDLARLLKNPGIVRNRLKIKAAMNNAKRFLETQKEFGNFSRYIWQFAGNKPILNKRKKLSDYPPKTKESEALARDLKKRGFSFLGPVICYAHMQATGLVNDHTVDCFRYKEVQNKIQAVLN
jgi:DNA-3-methyladenine glycosylase I